MRILLLADIHSNRVALEAIQEPFDVAICLGDIVEYGVEPGPCVDWVQKNCTHFVRGNHDHNCAQDVVSVANGVKGFKYLTVQTRALNRERMNGEQLRFLTQMPLIKFVALDGIRMLLVHATPRDPLDDFAPDDAALWTKRLEGFDVDLVCVGHTHRQFALPVGDITVVNPGSVGLQREGDPRARYAIIDGSQILLRKLKYDVDQSVLAVQASPLPDDVKQMLTHVYREGRLPE